MQSPVSERKLVNVTDDAKPQPEPDSGEDTISEGEEDGEDQEDRMRSQVERKYHQSLRTSELDKAKKAEQERERSGSDTSGGPGSLESQNVLKRRIIGQFVVDRGHRRSSTKRTNSVQGTIKASPMETAPSDDPYATSKNAVVFGMGAKTKSQQPSKRSSFKEQRPDAKLL